MDFKSVCIYKNCMDTNRRFTLSFHEEKKNLSQNRVRTLNTRKYLLNKNCIFNHSCSCTHTLRLAYHEQPLLFGCETGSSEYSTRALIPRLCQSIPVIRQNLECAAVAISKHNPLLMYGSCS